MTRAKSTTKTNETKKVAGAKKANSKKTVVKAAKEAAVTKTAEFVDIFSAAMQDVRAAEKEVDRLKDELSKAQTLMAEKTQKLNELKKIKSMSTYSEENSPFAWHMQAMEGSSYQKTAWREVYSYKTAGYDFTIVIKERTDLKKMKWEVCVYGSKIHQAEKLYNGSSYIDHNYVQRKYEGTKLEEKFSSEVEARKLVKCWQAQLIADHKEEIDAEQALSKLAKVMPRIKAGSIVRHEVYGTGTVVANIHGDCWRVKFDEFSANPLQCQEDSLTLIK
jgi:hypothetical protein